MKLDTKKLTPDVSTVMALAGGLLALSDQLGEDIPPQTKLVCGTLILCTWIFTRQHEEIPSAKE